MCNPASEENCRGSFGEVSWIKKKRARVNKVARVIEHHDDHHDAAQEIDGINARLKRLFGLGDTRPHN